MSYTHVQFIGHCIYTCFNNVLEDGKWKQEYTGDPDQEKDIKAKVDVVKKAMEQAHQLAKNEQTTLKIFMIPEMFFQARAGAYDPQHSESLVKELQKLVQDKGWKDWIFVFGTIVKLTGKATEDGKKEVSNFTLVQKGGGLPEQNQYIVQKIKSSSEFIKSEALTKKLEKESPVVAEKYYFAAAEDSLSAFTFELSEEKIQKTNTSQEKGKIVFGLETCADHGEGKISTKLQETQKQLGVVDIQLVPSAGSAILRDKIVVRDNGYVFNCDGWNIASGMRERTEKGDIIDAPAINRVEFSGHPQSPYTPHTEVLRVCFPKPAIDIKATEDKKVLQSTKDQLADKKIPLSQQNATFRDKVGRRTYIQIKGKVTVPIGELPEVLYVRYLPESLLETLLPALKKLEDLKAALGQPGTECVHKSSTLKRVGQTIEVEIELVHRVYLIAKESDKQKLEAEKLCESFKKELEERIKTEKVSISFKPKEQDVTLPGNKSFPKGLGKLHVYPVQPLPI